LVALQHALTQSLSPKAARISHGRASLNQLGALIDATTRPIPSEIIKEEVVPAQRDVNRDVAMLQQHVGKVCVGNCGQTHDVGRISAVVHFDHDTLGRVERWRLVLPSGDKAFDAKVLTQAEAMRGLALTSVEADRVPLWSEWKIEEKAYRWSSIERVLDPAFRPPGVRDPNSSDAMGLTTVVAEAVLVAVTYRP
jgi:hypothetical protein